ncbi:fasciclin-3 isoform X2 [Ostrinia nubilalis]|uniref:fasciclin-3 isoform X2 n=1 Tax=Ostrinia nubilalis TaxID=29057 RepID=UPI00308249FF
MAAFPAFFGLLMAAVVTGQMVDITPREAVRRVGDELKVLCKVPYVIDSCRMTVGTTSYRLRPDLTGGDVIYTGNGFKSGECGALIKNIKEEWNGNVTCVLPPQTGSIELAGAMRLVVARPPGEPQLRSPNEPSFAEDTNFMAQCVVPDGRPAARISWFLDKEQILHGTHQPIITSEPGSDLQTISQNISRMLTADDGGKTLTCVAEHEALDQPREARRQLIVHYMPKRLESGPITIFGLKLGAPGLLNVTVRANPPPHAEWRVGDVTLAPGMSNKGISALEPVHMGSGFYNISLFLPHISKEDVDRKYYLRASNELGAQEYTVMISTMDEPAGVELETGAIVGIVIAVLALLIAVFLVVFAKATDRWCFAGGRSRDNAKSSGESSDTESAVGGKERSRLAGLSARVRAVLPRAKDKVQATEAAAETEEKPLSEEKKGVVYAELQLGEQNADKPPPPSTEYAEIVYTDQPKETKE